MGDTPATAPKPPSPAEALFGTCSAYKARQLARKVNAHFDAYMAECGLKMTQFALLGFVGRFGPLQPSALAAHMALSASTLSRNIKPLVAQGWLAMGAGANARSRLLALTPEGQRLCKMAYKRWQQAQNDLQQRVGPAQLNALHGLLDHAVEQIMNK
jgi:DNA-binding MarR family transcriptional regulator